MRERGDGNGQQVLVERGEKSWRMRERRGDKGCDRGGVVKDL